MGFEAIAPVVTTAMVGGAAFFSLATYGSVNPQSTMWGPVISYGDRSSTSVALTFDDGPLPGATDRILDTLGEAGVRAAFYVIGCHAEKHPNLVRRMFDEGHVVGNHSFDHSHWGLAGRYRYWCAELKRTDTTIQQIIGHRPAMFRPPMGGKHWHVMNAAADAGHRVITWSRRAWDARATPANVIIDRLAKPARGGDIILLHDGNDPHVRPQDRSGVCAAVRPLIDELRQRGLEPVRLDDLLKIPAYQLENPSPQLIAVSGC
jgi:peptidoglycan/xylan/chitin deacetylase (PgdA/CDA1 family)